MARRRRGKGSTEVILVLLAVLVLLAAFAVVLAIMYPEVADEFVKDTTLSLDADEGEGIGGGFKTLRRRAGEGYKVRVAPRIRYVADIFTSRFSGRPKEDDAGPKKKKLGPVFAANTCMSGCHEHDTLFEQSAFGNVYIDHRLHDASDVTCRECHLDITHKPKPKRVEQETCLSCHERIRATTECGSCHPPGSLLDKDLVTSEKTAEFLSGSTAGSKSLVPHGFGSPQPSWLRGEGEIPCRQCHEVPRFCNACHLAFHVRIPDWPLIHGGKILRNEYTVNACWQCHDSTWCAGNCHVNAGVQRSKPYLKIPREGLRLD